MATEPKIGGLAANLLIECRIFAHQVNNQLLRNVNALNQIVTLDWSIYIQEINFFGNLHLGDKITVSSLLKQCIAKIVTIYDSIEKNVDFSNDIQELLKYQQSTFKRYLRICNG